jgi:hypothetical protein
MEFQQCFSYFLLLHLLQFWDAFCTKVKQERGYRCLSDILDGEERRRSLFVCLKTWPGDVSEQQRVLVSLASQQGLPLSFVTLFSIELAPSLLYLFLSLPLFGGGGF